MIGSLRRQIIVLAGRGRQEEVTELAEGFRRTFQTEYVASHEFVEYGFT